MTGGVHLTVIKEKDGNILSSEEDCKNRWKEHFEEILNRPISVNPINNSDGDYIELTTSVSQKKK